MRVVGFDLESHHFAVTTDLNLHSTHARCGRALLAIFWDHAQLHIHMRASPLYHRSG